VTELYSTFVAAAQCGAEEMHMVATFKMAAGKGMSAIAATASIVYNMLLTVSAVCILSCATCYRARQR
jgi:hypothetical protein